MLPHVRSSLKTGKIRAGVIGAGYIAEFHANAIGKLHNVELVAVCDENRRNAESFATQWRVPNVYGALSEMLEAESLDSLHVLVPPPLHFSIASTALRSGVNVFLEKPMVVSGDEGTQLCALAGERHLLVGVNHNMLFSPAYEKLRDVVKRGDIGPINHISLNFFQEVAQIRTGPFSSWMLNQPKNLLLELGPHIFSIVLDLIGMPDHIISVADRSATITDERELFRRWRVDMTVGQVSVGASIYFGPSFQHRGIGVFGLLGSAIADLDANTCAVDQVTSFGADIDRFARTTKLSGRTVAQAGRTLFDYAASKLKVGHRGNPYQATFIDSVRSFYSSLATGENLDTRLDCDFGRKVIDLCERVVDAACIESKPNTVGVLVDNRAEPDQRIDIDRPNVLVLGGSGFIGTELIRQLVDAGYIVRALVRGDAPALRALGVGQKLQLMRGNISNEKDLSTAMDGVEYVFHLARADAKSWDEYLRRDVDPTLQVGKLCLAKGIRRLVYTGTIDSYFAGGRNDVITEKTPLDRNIKRRNYYARAKAAGESALMEMYRNSALPVVIVRPGIVIGPGGNPFHWGVGMWSSPSLCQVWGDGNSALPFVLVSDVARALVQSIRVPNIEGRSFNLVDRGLLSARDYLSEVRKIAGINVRAIHRPIWWFYTADMFKWLVKLVVRHPDRARVPSYSDWQSRTQLAQFDCEVSREQLQWNPAADRGRLIEEGIRGSLKSWLDACA